MPVVFDSFKRIQIYDQSNPSDIFNINADDRRDTLTLAGGTGITLVVNDETDAITVVNTGVPDINNIGLNELLEGQHIISESPTVWAPNNESWRTIHIGEIQVHDYAAESVTSAKLSTMTFTGHSIESQLNNNLVLKPSGVGVVEIDASTALQVPFGSSAERPEDIEFGGARHIGQIRFNTDIVQFEGWDGAGWNTLGGVRSLDGGTTIKPEADGSAPVLNFYASDTVVAQFSVLNNKFLSKGLQIPVGTTAGRPEVEALGQIRFNTETVQFEGYNGTGWSSLGGVRDIDGNTYIVPETEPGANENTLYMYTNDNLAVTVDGDKVVVYNGREMQFRENISGGNNYAGITAPDNVTASYTLKLPTQIGSAGNLLGLGPNGQLEFVNSDSFAGGRVIVSAEYGSDSNDGINKPVKTLKRALQIASGLVYSPSFVYNEDACRRDAELLIEAMAWDLVTGSNWRTVKAALTYYNATASAVLTSQKTQTINSIKVLKNKIVDELEGTSATTVGNLCDVVIDILTNGTSVAPAVSMPAMPDSDVENAKAKDILLDNVNFAVAEVIAWIDYQVDNNISPFRSDFEYSEATCQRDTEIILGAVGYDMVLGTNYNAVTSGLAYQRGAVEYLQSYQKTQTLDALDFLKNEVLSLTTVQASTTATTRAGAAFDEIINILEMGELSTDVAADPLVFEPPVGVDVNLVSAKDQLVVNKDFIRTEIIAWINNNYKTLVYDNIKCSRDVGYIIDALCYDILYGGNSATVNAAKAYFSGSVAQLPTVDQKLATAAAFNRLSTVIQQVVQGTEITKSKDNEATQDTTGTSATIAEATTLGNLVQIIVDVINDDSINNVPVVIYPSLSWVVAELTNAKTEIDSNIVSLQTSIIAHINSTNPFVYNSTKCARDTELIVKSVAYDLVYGGNSQSIEAGRKYYNGLTGNAVIPTETTQTAAALNRLKTVLSQAVVNTPVTVTIGNVETQVFANPLNVGDANSAAAIIDRMTSIITILSTGATIASIDPTVTLDVNLAADKAAMLAASERIADNVVAFASDYQPNGKKVVINVGAGDYIEDNPVIIPDNVSVLGASLRACDIRPANANRDMFRLRNGAYFGEFTFRDFVDENGIPTHTWDYATVFDDVSDKETSRLGYTNLPISKPIISVSPYIQNVTILSFLGGNGAKVDGALVQTPNIPDVKQLVEYPLTGPVPEQGKSFVANAYTMLSFGGTGWRLTNDAYAQIVSCFQIFLLNGSYCQSGGYLSITNSATNFGLFAMRSSGYSKNAFTFDKGYVTTTGVSGSKQTLSVIGFGRSPTQDYVIRFRDPKYKVAYDLLMAAKEGIQDDTITWISDQITGNIAPYTNGFTYDSGTCSRDVGIIIDALGYDLAFGSNFQSVIAGMSYYRQQSADVVGYQKQATLDALEQLKLLAVDAVSGTPTAVNRVTANMNTIIDIVDNGLSAVPSFVIPDPTGYDSGFFEARRLLLANKAFLQSEVSAWINYQINNVGGIWSGFVYDQVPCERDVGYIIDALQYDITYGGNVETLVAAMAYYSFGTFMEPGEKDQALAVQAYLKSIIGYILTGNTSWTKRTSATQDISGTPGSSEAVTFLENRFQDIYDTINSNGIPPATITPSVAWTTTKLQNARTTLTNSKSSIQSGVINWITENYPPTAFTYNVTYCRRDVGLIIEGVAADVLSGGNARSVEAGVSQTKVSAIMQDQLLETIAAINYVKGRCQTVVAALSGVDSVIGEKFDIITGILSSPSTAPEAYAFSAVGDITSDYKPASTELIFDAATDINISTNIITINNHGLLNGASIIYNNNGNRSIVGLDDEQTYYVNFVNGNEFGLYFDESGTIPVDIRAIGTGTHKFTKNLQEFYVNEISETHNTYQELTLAEGEYTFTPGAEITGVSGVTTNNAYVYSYDPLTYKLVVSINKVIVGNSSTRNPFDSSSTIDADHGTPAVTNIDVVSVQAINTIYSATFAILSTSTGGELTNLGTLPGKQIWLHRPSVVNSSGHTWEYAGSGIDYNALPQNGGQSIYEYEQVADLPGRVYSSGTNELGDFKVGDFIKAENRTGNVSFTNKVSVAQLDALRLAVGDIVIELISNDIDLGDNEPGGASDSRLSTQKAIRSFMSNRLGQFIDKSVSTNAVPGAVIQLNSSGQINPDLLPAVRTFNSAKTYGYLNRLTLLEEVPVYDFLNGDIVTEEYSTVQLTLSAPINAYMGTLVVQATTGAQGYIVSDIFGDSVITVASKVVGATTGSAFNANFNTVNDLTIGGDATPSTTNTAVHPTLIGTYTANVNANYVLTNSNEGQFLKLLSSQSYSFTNGTYVTSTNDNIQGVVTGTRYGVIGTVDNASLTQGSGYTPLSGSTTYSLVPLTNVTGTGTGAYADITITNGKVTSVDMRRGGTGYAVGNELSALAANLGGTGSGFKIPVTSIEQRLYVSLIGGEKFVATLASPNFIADNNAPVSTITNTSSSSKTFNAQSVLLGGAVDYSTNRITINSHGFSNGDPVKYVTPGVAIGGLTNNEVFYVKYIDSNTIELYNDYSLLDIVEFITSATGTHSLTTYAYNLIDNSVYVAAHGWSTGDPVRVSGSDLPVVGGVKITSGSFFFIGSVTTNSFTLHASRTEALASVNGLVNNKIAFTSTGSGTSTFTKQNVIVQGVVNTSSTNNANWSPLSVTTINASSIVGGVISTSRLASTGVANDTTFLRGDSSWSTAVQSIYESDSPITLTGSFNTVGGKDYFYDDVLIDIERVDGGAGDSLYTNLGVAKFRKSQFAVGTTTAKGEVYIKDGVVDAGTLDGLDSTYYLNPANLTSNVPVNRGGTALSSYALGDMLYASGTTLLGKLSIGAANQILTSDGTKPVWSSSINIPGSLSVQNSVDSTSTSSGTLVVSGGVGIEKNVNVGASMNIGGDLNVVGNVNVAGTITTIKSSTVQVDDKNIELGLVQTVSGLSGTLSGNTISGLGSTVGLTAGMKLVKTTGTGAFGTNPTINTIVNSETITINITGGANTDGTITFDVNGATNSTADGGGITLLGTTNKTFNWVNASSAWTSSEHLNLASNKEYRIAGTKVLDATTLGSGVVNSSLTTVGTIGTGVWQGTIISPTYGGTGVNNGARTLTIATDNITLTATSGGSSVTVPTSGTLATLANTENLSNKTLVTPKILDGGADNTYNFAVANLAANRTISLPGLTSNDTFVFEGHTQTLTNKTLTTPKINDASANNTYNFAGSELTADRTVTLPLLGSDDTFVFEGHTQSLSNKTLVTPKILDSAGNNSYNVVVSDLAADRNITLPLLTTNDTFVFAAHTQTLTNKTLTDSTTYFQDDSDNTRKMQFQLSSISTGTTRTLTVPNQDGTIAVTSDIGNGTLTLGVSGTGLSGSATFTANQSGNATFTVTSNATSANTGGAIVARDANGDFSARYVSSSYVNTSDDVSTGNITYVMAKFGDNYHRSASAAKLAAFLSGQTLNIAGTSANADKLDNLDSTDFSRRQYNTQTNNLAVGWYTIAVNSGDRASARFILKDTASSYHQSVTFYASHFFGSNSDITVVHQSAYSTTPFRYIRIKEGGTYDGALLQVYIDAAASAVQAFVFENEQTSGWVLKDWVADSSNPGGVNNFAALTNVASQVDLDYGGSGNNTLITTGQIYAGGDTTQYVVWNSGNDGSGSGLDADLVDGLDVHTGRNNEANKIVRTDATGYLQVGYINSSSGDEGNNSSPTRVWGTNGTDSYLRTYLTSALSVNYAASAGNADTVDSLHVHAARNNEANKIVRTDATGYIQAGWINTTSGDNGTTAIDRVYASSDGYIRYYTPTNFRTVLNVPTRTGGDASGTWGINVTGSAGSVAASGITGQTGMWTSATRPGPYRLYRRDSDSDYSVQTYWTGSYWRLYGYNGDTAHADTYVGYADSAGSAGSASSASSATYGRYVYDNGTYSGTAAWREASSMYVAYASSAGSASSSSQVTINYNNDSNSTYQMLWGSGNSVYGTAGIYCNPYTDTLYATTFNGTATAAKYADLAENYLADAAYDVGTVLIIGGTQEVTISTVTHSPEVAGVVSTNPAHLMNAELKGDHVVAVALQGRVPVKVTGKIKKGDRLVASSKAGYACVMDKSLYEPGCIIGKALADFDGEEGVIEVLVGRV